LKTIRFSGVRLIRDKATSVGKGFGYVLFEVRLGEFFRRDKINV